MSFGWKPYVPVRERIRRAKQKVASLKEGGQPITPVAIEGRTIAASFWGAAWCTNLERYSDFTSRLPRGRTYVRNGSVVDLQIAGGEVRALVAGSELYAIRITIAPVKPAAWKAICQDCSGSVSSLVELLQGRLSTSVMDRVCRQGDGLFPSPRDIGLSCSCPDYASMCKHVAAALYAVGARLDSAPELLFVLRGVDHRELLSAGPPAALGGAAPAGGKRLTDDDVAALFGLDMAGASGDAPAAAPPDEPAGKRKRAAKAANADATPGRRKANARTQEPRTAATERPKSDQRRKGRAAVTAGKATASKAGKSGKGGKKAGPGRGAARRTAATAL